MENFFNEIGMIIQANKGALILTIGIVTFLASCYMLVEEWLEKVKIPILPVQRPDSKDVDLKTFKIDVCKKCGCHKDGKRLFCINCGEFYEKYEG